MSTQDALPTGLKYHCASCTIVVPSDAPSGPDADCAFVRTHKLAWFNPNEVPSGQHAMAVGAWAMIHDAALRQHQHKDSLDYLTEFRLKRKEHYGKSAVRAALSPEDLAKHSTHRRDGWLHVNDDSSTNSPQKN